MALKPSVCVDAVFENQPLTSAIASVKASGMDAFEFWGWWDRDLDEIRQAGWSNDLAISACCTKFVSLVDPSLREEYLRGLQATIDAAKSLDVKTIISQVGDFRLGVARSEQHTSLVDGLRDAVSMLAEADITLVIEPLNELVDHAGYYLVRSDEAFEIIEKVASPHVKVLYDIYHQQVSEGHLIHNIRQNIEKIGHFHAAGNPGRHELTNGEIEYRRIFDAIHQTDYDGYVALEYWPQADPMVGIREVATWFSAEK